MRYSASEKIEIIHTVEASHLPVKQTLSMIGVFLPAPITIGMLGGLRAAWTRWRIDLHDLVQCGTASRMKYEIASLRLR